MFVRSEQYNARKEETAGATEQNWNEFGQLYTRNRNRLKPERLRKLVFIYHNFRILAPIKVTKEFPRIPSTVNFKPNSQRIRAANEFAANSAYSN